ncbi:MAG TPA: F0F1 ATP synthase subunit A [Chthoniobacteraceae bacterium]|jgi:F-type H+-transporting ATPase subunit a|nr:F0F1 ATP synthase subunit A [Chthoniobacteraceae bacterium]
MMKRLCRLFILLLTLALVAGAPAIAHAEGTLTGDTEGLPLKSPVDFHIGPLPVSGSMLETWIVAAGIIFLAQMATRNIKEVPDGLQNFWEWMVEGLWNLLEGIIGHQLVKKTFWFFATIFILIVFTNWFGLIPGVGTIGWGPANGPLLSLDHISSPLLRGANADFNMTFAMAMLFFLMWLIWAFQANGPGGFLMHLFGPKGDLKSLPVGLVMLLVVLFVLVGVLEIVSILFRPISLSIRLYGNIFAGENMMDAMAHLVSHPAWLKILCGIAIPIPFYFMEMLTGIVQAMVFMLLTAVFTLLICQHSDDKQHGSHPH